MKLNRKYILIVVILAVLVLVGAGCSTESSKEGQEIEPSCKTCGGGGEPADYDTQLQIIAKVIDGDTIKLQDNTKIRLIGIDSPEKGQCYYEESTNFTTQLLENKSVKLEKDISGKDDYDRLLRYVIILNEDPEQDNMLVNDYIVRQGYAQAVASPPDNRYRDLLVSAQEEALREKRGLWKECDYEAGLSDRREKDNEPTDPDCIIKGNISTRGYGRIYLLPGCDNYNTVKIDFTKGEQYFCTEEEAQKADFRKATNCP